MLFSTCFSVRYFPHYFLLPSGLGEQRGIKHRPVTLLFFARLEEDLFSKLLNLMVAQFPFIFQCSSPPHELSPTVINNRKQVATGSIYHKLLTTTEVLF